MIDLDDPIGENWQLDEDGNVVFMEFRQSIMVCILSVVCMAGGGALSHGQGHAAESVFGGVELGEGWFFSEWYGYYNVSYDPWIFHKEHEWQLLYEGETDGEVYLFDLQLLDWWFTSESIYPAFYDFDLRSWSWFFKDTVDPRRFEDLETSALWSWGKLMIEVSGEWDGAKLPNIEKLLLDTASHINGLLRSPWLGQINVKPSDLGHPRVLYRSSRTDPITVLLSARHRKWSKYAYQFAHEFAHILSNHEDRINNPNNWFHETICELASVFTLRRMAERWLKDPPYLNWADYSESLLEYSVNLQNREEVQLPAGATLPEWIESEESSLRSDAFQRDKNALVAYSLLSLFEEQPSGWNTIRALPNSSDELGDYLAEWAAAVHPVDRQFIVDLAEILGYDIDSVAN